MYSKFVKRSIDFTLSLCGIVILSVPMIIIALIIKLDSKGPVFFWQKRVGLNKKTFMMPKFRTMRTDAPANMPTHLLNDPEVWITCVGKVLRKTSLDELPQMFSILKGDMSIVGPRPHMLKHTEEYSELIDNYLVRHMVKPGITGWAQVTGFRGETKELYQMKGRVEADIWYMEHWSFLLDLFIIYKTFANVVKGEKEAY